MLLVKLMGYEPKLEPIRVISYIPKGFLKKK